MKNLSDYIIESFPIDIKDPSIPQRDFIRKRFYAQVMNKFHEPEYAEPIVKNLQRFYKDTDLKYNDGDINEIVKILRAIKLSEFSKIVLSSESPAATTKAAKYFHEILPNELKKQFDDQKLINIALNIFKYELYRTTMVSLDLIDESLNINEANWRQDILDKMSAFEDWYNNDTNIKTFLNSYKRDLPSLKSRAVKQAWNIFDLAHENMEYDLQTNNSDRTGANPEVFWDSYLRDLGYTMADEQDTEPRDLCIALVPLIKDIFETL